MIVYDVINCMLSKLFKIYRYTYYSNLFSFGIEESYSEIGSKLETLKLHCGQWSCLP